MQINVLETTFYVVMTDLHNPQGKKSIFCVIADFRFDNYRSFMTINVFKVSLLFEYSTKHIEYLIRNYFSLHPLFINSITIRDLMLFCLFSKVFAKMLQSLIIY